MGYRTVKVYVRPAYFLGRRGVLKYTLRCLFPFTSMLTKLSSFATIGLRSELITVEVGATAGEGSMIIVGLGDTAVQESKQRVRIALKSSGYRFPTGRTITVNLAPADLKKVGPRYDLPIALGLLLVSDALTIEESRLKDMAFVGELALDGSLRHVSGVLSAAIACRRLKIPTLVVPAVNAPEAALIPGVQIIGVSSLKELTEILTGERMAEKVEPPASSPTPLLEHDLIDFADIRGQAHAKRALEIAAAGGHNVLLSGAPGAGKTLLARAFRGILPQRGVFFLGDPGGSPPRVLEVLRQPLEDRHITITRAQGAVTFPADFTMIAAMNPPEFSSSSARKIG